MLTNAQKQARHRQKGKMEAEALRLLLERLQGAVARAGVAEQASRYGPGPAIHMQGATGVATLENVVAWFEAMTIRKTDPASLARYAIYDLMTAWNAIDYAHDRRAYRSAKRAFFVAMRSFEDQFGKF